MEYLHHLIFVEKWHSILNEVLIHIPIINAPETLTEKYAIVAFRGKSLEEKKRV